MPQLIADLPEDYEQKALALVRDPQMLIELRRTLEQSRDTAPLFDLPRLAKNIEAAYARMWSTYCAGEKPVAFSIESGQQADFSS